MPKQLDEYHARRLRDGDSRFVAERRELRDQILVHIAPYRILRVDEHDVVLAEDGEGEESYQHFPTLRDAISAAFDLKREAQLRTTDAERLAELIRVVEQIRNDMMAVASAKASA